MNWYKKAQLDNVSRQYTNLMEHAPIDIRITGSGVNQTIAIPGGKTISARDLIQKAVNKIKPILLKNNVNEIDTNSISRQDAQGLAVSSEAGKVHIDIAKIFNAFRGALPTTVQTDGANTDPDQLNSYIDRISNMILAELGETAAHESQHMSDYFNAYRSNQPFTSVQEAPGEQFGKKIRKEHFPEEFRQ